MNGVWVVLAASALLGLAIGLVFRVWAMILISLIIASASAIIANLHGYGLTEGVLTVIACLFVSQATYLVATFMAPPREETRLVTDDVTEDDSAINHARDVDGD